MKFKKHVFICTNERSDGSRPSCGLACGMNLVSLFKKSLKDRGLKGLIRAQRAGCLDSCEQGPSLVVYPDNAWYGGVQPHHVEQIIDDHLVNDQPVEKLLIDWGVEEEKST